MPWPNRKEAVMKPPHGLSHKIEILETLLNDKSTVHPPGCNCALKTRSISAHARDCPWRILAEDALPALKSFAAQTEGRTK